uniref:Uncharacterized protein n=1 Tax=Pithovirus LCDPAC02 TaxID=2506601 RepID=A0A481YQV7_9VIRU|nr:MAG: hypothetical protein LCDPAC02_00430 [Pithovirus LCDPAC02]
MLLSDKQCYGIMEIIKDIISDIFEKLEFDDKYNFIIKFRAIKCNIKQNISYITIILCSSKNKFDRINVILTCKENLIINYKIQRKTTYVGIEYNIQDKINLIYNIIGLPNNIIRLPNNIIRLPNNIINRSFMIMRKELNKIDFIIGCYRRKIKINNYLNKISNLELLLIF